MRCAAAMWMALCMAVVACCHGASAATYTNPVVGNADVPDPGVLYVREHHLYYVATTSGDAANSYPIRTSSDLVHWKFDNHHIFPAGHQPKWAKSDFWAPEIHQLASNSFVAYFAARTADGLLCVGVAIASHPLGPWVDPIGAPLVRNDSVGSIDPTYHFREHDHTHWLIWKEDGNGHVPMWPTPIWLQQLTDDGTKVVGEPHRILEESLPWEGVLVEAPWLMHRNDTYYLFYSANGYATANYAVGVAQSRALEGPYTKHPTPIVHTPTDRSANKFYGPGHCSVVALAHDPARWAMVYHSWDPAFPNDRVLLTDAIVWTADAADGLEWPHVAHDEPSYTPQPIP